MKIKRVSFLIMLFVVQLHTSSFAQSRNNMVYLSGVTKNFNNQIQIEDMSELKDLVLPNAERMFTPDSNHNFAISFKLEKPGYFRMGRNILYLSPGDSMVMFVNYVWQDSSTFKGKGSQANEYLKYTSFPKGGSFLHAGDNVKPTIQQTVDTILQIADKRSKVLNSCSTISKEFKLLEHARIHADIINSLKMINTYFPWVNKISKDSLEIFKTEYTRIVDPYISLYSKKIGLNPSFLQLVVYRDVVPVILSRVTGNIKSRNIIDDWIKASDLVDEFKTLDEKRPIHWFKKAIDSIKTPLYKTTVINTFKQLMEFGEGDTAADFIMTAYDGKPVALSDYKGKIIYIDLWATWCGPCMEELPFIDTLKEKYKQNKEIVFISLSIDSDKQKWLNSLKERHTFNNQFIIDRAKLDAYHVSTIPRVIIVNSAFKIESMSAGLPSAKNTITILDKILKQ